MPTEKFSKLCEYKRQTILEAMCDEFLQTSYSDITVGRVIKRADISRASFYMYFSGKEDLFCSMLAYMRGELGKKLVAVFREKKGSYYNSMQWVLRMLLEDDLGQKYCRLYKKLMIDKGCREVSAQVAAEFFGKGSWSEEGKRCYAFMNGDRYPGLDEERLAYAIDIGLAIIIKAAVLSLDGGSNSGRQEEAARKQLEILEKGISA